MRYVRLRACAAAAALLCLFRLSVSAALFKQKGAPPESAERSRTVVVGQTARFSGEDFGGEGLAAVTLTRLPDAACGELCVGGQPLEVGAVIRASALDGVRFCSSPAAQPSETAFTFLPAYDSGAQGREKEIRIRLLARPNEPPIAEEVSVSTYKNVAVTGYFRAVDAEGAALTYQLTSAPARGSVTTAEDGSGRFTYTPYAGKTGKDSFTYVATDPAGNVSNPARVSVRIEKAASGVSYADMADSGDHKAAVRLAEEGVFVGDRVGGEYFFRPAERVTRSEFLVMAMTAAGVGPLREVALTGFADDGAIPAWARGHVASALSSGTVGGMRDAAGQAVFRPDEAVTRAQAAVILDRLMDVSDVAVESWSALGVTAAQDSHWAMSAAVDLSAAGILPAEDSDPARLDAPLTRADAARMLDRALDVLAARGNDGWFLW